MLTDMKNITFTADETIIKKAREKAKRENTSLNKRFGEWLKQYTSQGEENYHFDAVMDNLNYVNSGKKFTREELNE